MYDLYGLGNALVDLEYRVDDSFLTRHEVAKGHMTLVEAPRLKELMSATAELEPARFSGGSAANTVIAAQALGHRCFYSCKVSNDEVGQFFMADMADVGVALPTTALNQDAENVSGRCLVLITDDAQRSMNTFLGISATLGTPQLDTDALAQSRYFYVEGYMVASPTAQEATLAAKTICEESGTAFSLSLSDPSMVQFFRENLEAIIGNGIDVLFCNEEEALTFTGTDRVDLARRTLTDAAKHVHITLSERGSQYTDGKVLREIPGYSIDAVDTTGAGDAFAGACLHAIMGGAPHEQAAAFGNYVASTLVGQYGARFRSVDDYQRLKNSFS